jgi:hypothetical protein
MLPQFLTRCQQLVVNKHVDIALDGDDLDARPDLTRTAVYW